MTKNKLVLPLFLSLVIVVASPGCDKKVAKVDLPTACDTTSYTRDVKAIIDNKCVSCHSNAPGSTGGFPLTTYGQVKAKADEGKIKARVIDQKPSSMPPTGSPQLTQEEREKINCWLSNGAKE